jgi:LCP family protein required for cell wall assembly
MNDFRKLSRRSQQKAIDGIINAPSRPAQFGDSGARSFDRRPVSGDRLRATAARRVDNFSRPEGYHAAARGTHAASAPSVSTPAIPAPGRGSDASLLQSTLAGAKAKETAKKHGRHARSNTKGRRKRSIRKIMMRTTLVTATIFLLMGGFLFAKGYIKLHKVFKGGGTAAALKANVNPTLLKGEGDGRINVLLMGKGGPGHDGADLTDTILLASIDPINKTASLVSVPRDLWVTTPGYGSTKVNAVYANAKYHAQALDAKDKAGAEKAGINTIEKSVSQVLGVPIHYYAMVDFSAFEQAVNTVGGVDMNVPATAAVSEHLWDESTRKNYYLNVGAGQQHFDGQRALFYARSRHTSPRGDFDRGERQRLLIEALSSKVLSAGTYTNPVKISQLMSTFGDHVSTDMSITDAKRLGEISKGIKFASLDLADPAGPMVTTGMISGQSVVLPTAGAGNYDQINSFVRNKLRDAYLAKEDANVSVLNGTETAGLATKKANELKSYGYNVGTVGDAPTHAYQKTTLVDLTNGKDKYTQNYLEKRLGVKAVRKLPDTTIQPGSANFVIIIGQDEESQ